MRCSSDSSVSARWAATCASGCAAPVIEVVGFDRNPEVSDVDSLESLVERPARPPRRVGHGPRRRARPARRSTARRPARAEGDLVIDGGNCRFTDDTMHAEALGRQAASATSTAASAAASGAWRTATA